MKENSSQSFPKRGMNKDSHISNLDKTEYSFAMNANTELESGEGLNIFNEPSNYLSTNFNGVVIGFRKDILTERTYIFLTNTSTKRSSVGYISSILEESFNNDITSNCAECNTLDAALENITQTPSTEYVELINDECLPVGEGLNFDINFPVKHIEIKQEKLGTILYWTDYNNNPRYLNVTDIEERPNSHYLLRQEVPCAEDIILDCIQVHKLLQFPQHKKPLVEAEAVQTGGNLRLGTYEFYIAYSDVLGNELTTYSTPTNPVSIFDENNTTLEQTQLDAFTNYAIRVKVNNLDSTFSYYKVVVIERVNVNNTPSAFIAGIYPTSDDTILYTSTGSIPDLNTATGNTSIKERFEIDALKLTKPFIEKTKGLTIAGNRMYQWGLKVREEINLQPVVNIFSSLIKWQTSVAKEDLYKHPIATSKFKGFMRNEVQPFALRFYYKDGDYTAAFPLIGRPDIGDEKAIIDVNNLNYKSLNESVSNCTSIDRNKNWQIYNTAFVESGCQDVYSGGTEVSETQTKYCTNEDIYSIDANTVTIPIEDGTFFSDLETFVKENPDVVIEDITDALNDTYVGTCEVFAANNCSPPELTDSENSIGRVLSAITVGDILVKGQEYLIDFLFPGDDFTGTGYEEDFQYFTATGIQPPTWNTTIVLETGKQNITYNLLDISEYGESAPPQTCNQYRKNDDGTYLEDTSFMSSFMDCDGGFKEKAVFRNFTANNEKCNTAITLPLVTDTSLVQTAPLFHKYYGADDIEDLLLNKWTYNTNMDFVEELHFSSGTTGTVVVTINDVTYNSTFATSLTQTATNFYTNHKAGIELSTGGVVTRVGDKVFITNPINGFVTNIARTTSDFVIDLNSVGFSPRLNKGALFFKVSKPLAVDKIVFEITQNTNCVEADAISKIDKLRYNIFTSCSADTAVDGGIVETADGALKYIDVTVLPTTFFIAIDVPLVNNTIATGDCVIPTGAYKIVARTAPPCGCFNIFARQAQYDSVDVTWGRVTIDSKDTYTTTCTFFIPKIEDCEPKPYQNGSFAYWESTETYPNNDELYNSSNIKVFPQDLVGINFEDREKFKGYYTDNGNLDQNGNYVWKSTLKGDSYALSTDFTCRNIRHFKFPSNNVAPFILDSQTSSYAEAIICPLGISIPDGVVETMLKVAVKNGLITQAQKNNIAGYEILKGDNTIHKSIIANGLGYDMYKYEKYEKDHYYSNFPFNDLGDDIFHYDGKDRKNLIAHPFKGIKNNKFTFISPDLLLSRNVIPTEVVLSGFQLGNSSGYFVDVEDHPKWTILGSDARNLATALAIAEGILEVAIKGAELIADQWAIVGVSGVGGSFNYIATGIAGIAYIAGEFTQVGKYRYAWLKIFRDLGGLYNFSNYYVAHGKHNKFLKNTVDYQYIRGISSKRNLKDGRYKIVDDKNGETISLNNYKREWGTYFSLGKEADNCFEYPYEYYNNDNNVIDPNLSSKVLNSQVGCETDVTVERNIGSPYFTLQNFVPDQFGTIDSVKWLTTNNSFKIEENTDCQTLFGGTVSISRFTWKRKIPMFTSTAMGLPDKLPFNYEPYRNVGYPRFYCNYEVDTEYSGFKLPFPDIDSEYHFDCETGRHDMYVKPPSKMYLYNYGIVDFLVESEINCNFRYGKTQLKDQFYPAVGDIVDWTQEKNVSITEPNSFYYNNVYSYPVSSSAGMERILPTQYNKNDWSKLGVQDNSIMYSEIDRNENSKVDPFLIYKPLNRYDAATKYGKLISLKGMSSDMLLGRFENQQVVFNAVDVLADRLTPTTSLFGSAGVFQSRPMDFVMTDLGYGGTQHTDMVSTPYGHFSVDAKRGKVFQLNETGLKLEPISDFIGGKPSGMKNWFKEHLPFNILKHFPNLDTDNKFAELGISMGYDSRFERVFITKKDYIPKVCVQWDKDLGFVYNKTQCENVEQIESCPEGYTLNTELNICEKKISSSLCPVGYSYNSETNMCDAVCNEGIDIVFILDATTSQQPVIDNIKNSITTSILPSIIAKFGTNYRLGLSAVYDRRTAGQALFDIVVPMTSGNEAAFMAGINSIDASVNYGNANLEEPTDQALKAVLNNLPSWDLNNNVVGSTSIGDFRTSAAKLILMTTDELPSGLDDLYQFADWTTSESLANQALNSGINIFTSLTALTEPSPVAPILPSTPPNKTYILQNYANVTNGSYSFNSSGSGIDETIVEAINAINCTSEVEILCLEGCTNTGIICECTETAEIIKKDVVVPIKVTDSTYFEDVSWTIAYKASEGSWVSFYSFKPTYYISHQNFFQTGKNTLNNLWTHPLNNTSFQVFYGKLDEFSIEYPIANQNANKMLSNISLNVEAKRWQNQWDYSVHKGVGFNKAVIWNNTNNSGILNLVEQKSLVDVKKYPKTNSDNTQDILFTSYEGNHIFNTFFNRVLNQNSNIPQWLWDKNRIIKTVNSDAVSFKGKRITERIKGETFLVNLSNTDESRFSITLKSATNSDILIE